jgi:hypothetical protein
LISHFADQLRQKWFPPVCLQTAITRLFNKVLAPQPLKCWPFAVFGGLDGSRECPKRRHECLAFAAIGDPMTLMADWADRGQRIADRGPRTS